MMRVQQMQHYLLMESWMSRNFSNWRLNLHGLQWSSRLKRLENQCQPTLGANLYNEPCKESKQNIAFSRLSLTVRNKNLVQECDSGKLKALTRIVPRRHIRTGRNLLLKWLASQAKKSDVTSKPLSQKEGSETQVNVMRPGVGVSWPLFWN